MPFRACSVLINLASQATVDGVDTDTLSSIENAIGSKFADRIVAGADANRLEGSDGNDTFVFRRGHANSDIVVDFNGNGGARRLLGAHRHRHPRRRGKPDAA